MKIATIKLTVFIILITFTPVFLLSKSAEAAILDSQMLSSDKKTSGTREVNVKKVRQMLENKIVAERLRSYGISNEKLNERLKSMTDEQIHQLAALSDRITAGGNGAVVGLVIGILVVVVLVLLILYLLKRV